ncbi:molybdenum cofactor guanylyltransferase [Nonomuraea lactucae]|uniref:molybdenum cofactor guanylyltransferase n=1 Tax=Nonomuraea lactucae TaxID=2249762 RepID=UPI000DE50252|nr:molybdenum cofactor guanylyltransferase [Nonomuraea lactucae]
MGGGGYDAVILAGGEARRLGGVDKPGLAVGGRTLLERVVRAVPGAGRVVVVGPEREMPGVVFTREDPPGGGPVPALRAGLREVTAPWLVLLAGDLPFLGPSHVAALLEASGGGAVDEGGAVAVDGDGREQWLLGAWDAGVLRAALDGYAGRSLHGLLAPLVAARVALPGRAWFDCDTMDDLKEARVNDTSRVPSQRQEEAHPPGRDGSGRAPTPR